MTANNDWFDQAAEEAWEEAQKKIEQNRADRELEKYQEDPIGFAEDLFGDFLTEDMKETMISVMKNPVTIAKSGNAVGKTYSAAKIALWFFSVYENSKIFLTAAPPLDNLKRLLWGEIIGAVNKKAEMFEGYKQRSLYLERDTTSFIQCLTIPQTGTPKEREAKFSGKHSSHMLFIVDEGDAVPPEVYSGIDSCMSGGHARLLIMFNPRHKAGPVYHKEKNRVANIVNISAMDHPNVVTGKNLIPGAVDRQTVVKRINEWTRPLKAKEDPEKVQTFEVPDYLIGSVAQADDGSYYEPLKEGTRKVEEASFSYMVLGEYPAQSESQLISEEWIVQAQQRWKLYVANHGEQRSTKPKAGLDVAEMGTDENQLCLRYGGFVSQFDNYWSGIDTDATATRTLSACIKHNVDILYVDGTSWGSSVAPSVSRQAKKKAPDLRAVGVKIANAPEDFLKIEMGEFYQLRDQLYWAIRKWLREDETAMLPPDAYLVEELMALQYEVTNKGEIKVIAKDKLRKLLKRSPNKADALALTFAPYERAKVMNLGG